LTAKATRQKVDGSLWSAFKALRLVPLGCHSSLGCRRWFLLSAYDRLQACTGLGLVGYLRVLRVLVDEVRGSLGVEMGVKLWGPWGVGVKKSWGSVNTNMWLLTKSFIITVSRNTWKILHTSWMS